MLLKSMNNFAWIEFTITIQSSKLSDFISIVVSFSFQNHEPFGLKGS